MDEREIEARANAATPGPWEVDRYHLYVWGKDSAMVADSRLDEAHKDLPHDPIIRARGVGGRLPIDANMDFIAHAREDIPALLSALRAAREEIARLEKLVFVPGMMKCAKCGFVGMHMVLRASDGAVSVKADLKPDTCPNGCGPLWRVSERESGNEVCDRLEKSVLHERELEADFAKLREERAAVMRHFAMDRAAFRANNMWPAACEEEFDAANALAQAPERETESK